MSDTMSMGLATRDSSPPQPRQKYGAACEECRRRKWRCDRRRPQCGVCQASGMQCHVAVSRAPRGPKPGYIKDLQARIAALEGSITQANQQQQLTSSSDCAESAALKVSQAPFDSFYFGEPQALKLDIPTSTYSYPDDAIQAQHISASPLTTVGLPWKNTLAGTQLSQPGMLDTSYMSTLNYSLSPGEPLMPNLVNNAAYTSPVSPSASGKLSTVSTVDSSSWSDVYEGTPLGSPCMSRKMSTISSAHSPTGSDGSGDLTSSGSTHINLDHAYWENIHQFAPIIHQRRYLSWNQRQNKSSAQIALQYSMWALAASTVTEYTRLDVDRLYRCAVRALQAVETNSVNESLKQSDDLEQVQAQLLLSMYELKHVDFRQGWITAGCAFRLIQYGWFQDLVSGLNSLSPSVDWIELEEKRRTFWLAYYLDRIISLRSDSLCTFGEEALIPLPVPDSNFQHGVLPGVTVNLTDCLGDAEQASEAMASEFTESIILATICGYALSHRRQLLLEQAQCSGMDRFWSRYRQINSRLTKRADLSAPCYPGQPEQIEPALLFQSIMWRTIVLYMYQTMNIEVAFMNEKYPGLEYFQEASVAAQNLMILTDHLVDVKCSKLHPLTLIPLNMCSKLLETWPDLAISFKNKFRSISEAIKGPKDLSVMPRFSWEGTRAPEIIVRSRKDNMN